MDRGGRLGGFIYRGRLQVAGLGGLTVLVLLAILFFGLRAKGYQVFNQVSWLVDRPGIRIDPYGIAFSDLVLGSAGVHSDLPAALTFEMAVKPGDTKEGRFKVLLMLHGGRDEGQLVVGQWGESLIVMNGADYDGSRGLPKISVQNAFLPDTARLITITSGSGGTAIYLDGALAQARKGLHLRVPGGRAGARLVVGNTVYGNQTWSGEIFGLAIYEKALTSREIGAHFEMWAGESRFPFDGGQKAKVLYLFDEGRGGVAENRAGSCCHLNLPKVMQPLKREFLAPPNFEKMNAGMALDVMVNLGGFIPFGFLLSALLSATGGGWANRSFWMVVGICFFLSLGIETAQAFMPSRSSQSLDLVLNTVGGAIGAKVQGARLKAKEGKRLKVEKGGA